MEKGNFGKIRSAVEIQAETLASNELLEKPKDRHYADAFESFRAINNFDPDFAGELISYLAELKELKNKLGSEKYESFRLIHNEYEKNIEPEREIGLEQIMDSDLSDEGRQKEMIDFIKRSIERNNLKFREDQRIKDIFADNEEILDQVLDLMTTRIISMMEKSVKSV